MSLSLLSSGSNAHGQLANGTTDDAHTFTPAGANHTLVLTDSTLWGCGDGSSGQLGNCGRETDETVFRPIDLGLAESGLEGYQARLISSTWETSYVVLSSQDAPDVLISMGRNDFGDLGVGASVRTNAKLYHTIKFDHLCIGGLPLDERSLRVLSLAAGQHHVVVQIRARFASEDGESNCRIILVGWGAARHGQLGDTSSLDKRMRFFALPRIIDIPRPDDPVLSFALGNQHSVFRHQSGRGSCLGSNKKSQTNGLDAFQDISFVGCTWNGTYCVDVRGVMYATGSHLRGQLGRSLLRDTELASSASSSSIRPERVEVPFSVVPSPESVIACGSEHVLVLRTNCTPAQVFGWGWNEHGNMGLDSTEDVYVPTKLWPRDGEKSDIKEMEGAVEGVWAGCGTSWIAIRN
ncbi:hypothetical protein D9757_007204 [Collybiopsis confluens]|uniref:RCC1/BLIP-II protein n=1 Tax=Collybiopsis confluens TaxID=2823264 RepID=A0A8H5HAX9_9AGAR|nr:hypothetical protein D9757_007204 [Collybiopsis confluens]